MQPVKKPLLIGAVLAGIVILAVFAVMIPRGDTPTAAAHPGGPMVPFLPDLRVESVVSRWDGQRLQHYIEVTVRNVSSTAGTSTTFNAGATASSGRWAASTYIAGLGAGQTKVVRFYRGGTCGFDGTAWVDVPSVVGESNEGNNSRAVSIVC